MAELPAVEGVDSGSHAPGRSAGSAVVPVTAAVANGVPASANALPTVRGLGRSMSAAVNGFASSKPNSRGSSDHNASNKNSKNSKSSNNGRSNDAHSNTVEKSGLEVEPVGVARTTRVRSQATSAGTRAGNHRPTLASSGSMSAAAVVGSLPAHVLAGRRAPLTSSGRSQADHETSYGSYANTQLQRDASTDSFFTSSQYGAAEDPFGLSSFCCHNPSCRKPLALDPSFMDMGPSFFAEAGLLEMAEMYSSQLAEVGADPVRSLFAAAAEFTGVLWPLCVSCARKVGQRKTRDLETLDVELKQQQRFLSQLGFSADAAVSHGISEDAVMSGVESAVLVAASPNEPASVQQHPVPSALAAMSGDAETASLSVQEMESLLAKLDAEERQLRTEVRRASLAGRDLARDAMVLQRAEMAEAQLEHDYWCCFAEFVAEAERCANRQAICAQGLAIHIAILDTLISTHSLNDAFHIWHDGHFGTINRFRLGRLPSQPVDWHELNAAWGLAAHLLLCLQRALRVEFRAWKILPHGSFSRIQRRSDGAVYELYGSSDISLGRLFWYRRFDQAMVGFLQCIAELGEYAESRDHLHHFKLPHAVEKDRIGEGSIRSQFNNEEAWTKALKCTLTNLKYIAAFVALDNVSRAKKARAKHIAKQERQQRASGGTEGSSMRSADDTIG